MEFLNHKATLAELRPAGLVEVPISGGGGESPGAGANGADGPVRLSLDANGKSVKSVHRAALGLKRALAACDDDLDSSTPIDDRDALPRVIENLLHKHRVNEALVIPVGKWRSVCDVLAFELASDPSWQDVDAEASLHLNTRDPLLLTPRDFHIVPTMLGALMRAAPDDGSGEHDLTIVAAGVGMLVEFRASGAVVLTAANPAFCDELAEMV